jgi:hypothetical protein
LLDVKLRRPEVNANLFHVVTELGPLAAQVGVNVFPRVVVRDRILGTVVHNPVAQTLQGICFESHVALVEVEATRRHHAYDRFSHGGGI